MSQDMLKSLTPTGELPAGFDAGRYHATTAACLSLQLRDVTLRSIQSLLAFFLRYAVRRQRLRLKAMVAEARRKARSVAADERRAEAESERQKRELSHAAMIRAEQRATMEKRKRELHGNSNKFFRGPAPDSVWR